MTPLGSEAVAGLNNLGARFVCWCWEARSGKPTKPPLEPSGTYADSTDPATWCSLDDALEAAERPGIDGIGFVLDAARDGIVGIDLDGCRDPVTGHVEGWATKIINGVLSYTEVSPSGTGVKILVRSDPVPVFAAHKVVISKVNGSGKDEQVEVYTTSRYFCLTGKLLPGTPDEIVENTEAVERLAHWLAKQAGTASSSSPGPLPQAFVDLLASDDTLRDAWGLGRKLGAGADTSASALDWSLALYLRPHLEDGDIAAVLRTHRHGQIGGGKLRGAAAERRIEKILAELPIRRHAAEGPDDDSRPAVWISGGNLHGEVGQAERALGQAENIYQRGSTLVRVATIADPSADGIRRVAGSLVILPYERAALRVKLTEAVNFQRFDKRTNKWLPVNCPSDLADAVLASAGRWPTIPPLLGIVEAPTLRPDGSVLDQPGYDAKSGLYFADGGVSFPAIPEAPTADDAARALQIISEPFRDFPFKEEADKSVAISGVFTALVRRSLRSAPAFAVTAPKMGAGKTGRPKVTGSWSIGIADGAVAVPVGVAIGLGRQEAGLAVRPCMICWTRAALSMRWRASSAPIVPLASPSRAA